MASFIIRGGYSPCPLGAFQEALNGAGYPPIGQSWRRNRARITTIFKYPPEILRVIYATNAIESPNLSLWKITKNRSSFPSDEALLKLFYLAQQNISKKWTMPIRDWKAALNRFAVQFGDGSHNSNEFRLHKIQDTLGAPAA